MLIGNQISQAQVNRTISFEQVTPFKKTDTLLPLSVKSKLAIQSAIGFTKAGNNKTKSRLLLLASGQNEVTQAARWLSASLSKILYRINLTGFINKYIGETEKNLDRLFDKAASQDCILLFEEADDLFSKRTATDTNNASYTNQDTGYLLHLIEQYQGIVLITCNGKNCLTSLQKNNFTTVSLQ